MGLETGQYDLLIEPHLSNSSCLWPVSMCWLVTRGDDVRSKSPFVESRLPWLERENAWGEGAQRDNCPCRALVEDCRSRSYTIRHPFPGTQTQKPIKYRADCVTKRAETQRIGYSECLLHIFSKYRATTPEFTQDQCKLVNETPSARFIPQHVTQTNFILYCAA